MAFQKAQGLGRDGVAGPATQVALGAAARPAPRRPRRAPHSRSTSTGSSSSSSRAARPTWVLNTSTGNGEAYAAPGGGTAVATTPTGRFTIEREIDGLREAPLGTLYRPKYFNGGIAIHGSGSIPATGSHGCARSPTLRWTCSGRPGSPPSAPPVLDVLMAVLTPPRWHAGGRP